MRPEGSITHWIHEIKDGNHAAAQGLWERYFTRIVSLAKKELRTSNRRVSDEEDVAIKVFESFCRSAENGRFPDLSDRDGLWRLLVKMTARKAIDQSRRQSRQRRGSGNVRGESVFRATPNEDSETLAQIIGDAPTPEFVVSMKEQVSRLLGILDSDELRELALAKMEGFTNKELAERFDCSERTIERRLKLVRAKCDQEYFD